MISIEQKTAINAMLASFPPEISEHTFTNLFIWRHARDTRLAEADGAIIVYEVAQDVAAIFGTPIGDLGLKEAQAAVEAASGLPVVAIERLPERSIAAAASLRWTTEEDRDNFDYVYRREDLAELAGRNYHAKRNLIAQCLAEHDCNYEEITPQNLAEVRNMMDRWCKARECGNEPGLCHEYQAQKQLFDHYWELGVTGAAIRVDGRIEAFTVGERLNSNTAVIHFEKAMPEVKGLYQLINQWFCRNHLSDFEFINREQDLGLAGLRKAKESYFPHHLVKKFLIYPQGVERARSIRERKELRCPE